jgi:hypothetical protein
MSESNGNGSNQRLVYWIMGALLVIIGITSGIAHASIMRQMDSMERRMERMENRIIDAAQRK